MVKSTPSGGQNECRTPAIIIVVVQEWPLTVNSVKLCCKYSAVWVEHDKRKYGLNGFAGSLLRKNGHRCFELEEIWGYREVLFSNPTEFEMRIPIGRLLRDGLALDHEE